MKIRYNINTCDHPAEASELMIHFTKVCPNNCSFCIDKINYGVATKKPDVDAIIKTINKYKDEVKNITISGGEPFIFINELKTLVDWIKENTTLKILIITSVPNICYDQKDKFFYILDKCDNIQISLQHYTEGIADEIRKSRSNFDRNIFYKEIIEHCGNDKILGSINIIKPYFLSKYDIITQVMLFHRLGFKNIKIFELFDADEFYIDIPKMLHTKMNSPFAWGCKTEYKKANGNWCLGDTVFNGHLYIKRSCFMRSRKHEANIWDFIKMCTRWIFAKKYFFGVIHENGVIAPYWI